MNYLGQLPGRINWEQTNGFFFFFFFFFFCAGEEEKKPATRLNFENRSVLKSGNGPRGCGRVVYDSYEPRQGRLRRRSFPYSNHCSKGMICGCGR